MAVATSRPVATAPAVFLASNPASEGEGDFRAVGVVLKNRTKTASIFLASTAALAAGATAFEWEATDAPFECSLEPGEALYGYATSPQTVHVLQTGR